MRRLLVLGCVSCLFACGPGETEAPGTGADSLPASPGAEVVPVSESGKVELLQYELLKADRAFDLALQTAGPSKISDFYSEGGAVVVPGVGAIRGPEAIRDALLGAIRADQLSGLTWSAERAEVSRSGDLGYTTGGYILRRADGVGGQARVEGRYINVWRRQADGTWKVELSAGNTVSPAEVVPDSTSGGGDAG